MDHLKQQKEQASSKITLTKRSRLILTAEEAELYELCNLAGFTIDPDIFKSLLELLRMNVVPSAVAQMIHSMAAVSAARSSQK